jgi:hypothetical protein
MDGRDHTRENKAELKKKRKVSRCPQATLVPYPCLFVYLLSRSLHSAVFFACIPSREKPASVSTPVCGAGRRPPRGEEDLDVVRFGSSTSPVFLRFGSDHACLLHEC